MLNLSEKASSRLKRGINVSLLVLNDFMKLLIALVKINDGWSLAIESGICFDDGIFSTFLSILGNVMGLRSCSQQFASCAERSSISTRSAFESNKPYRLMFSDRKLH